MATLMHLRACTLIRLDFSRREALVGSDRCMFGTENPGTGSYRDPATGKMLDDLKPEIEGLASLTSEDKRNIFEDVARKVFPRFKAEAPAAAAVAAAR